MREMAKRNALVRKMPAVETLGCTTVICSDKTGTLTKGEMTVRRVFGGTKSVEVSGVGYAPEGSLSPASNNPSLNMLFRGGILCNDSALLEAGGKWSIKGDPTEAALMVLAAKAGLEREQIRNQCPRIGEFPFSSDRKRMTTIHSMEGGRRRAFMKGAPEVILDRCSSILNGDEISALDDNERTKIFSARAD
jgi:Ca2+-transporting ATPase